MAWGDGISLAILELLAFGGLAILLNCYGERKATPENEKASAEVDIAKEDYLSRLPDGVLSSILAYLDMRDAVRASILSRRWKYLYAFMPTLKFRCLDIFGISCDNHDCSPYYQDKYVKVVNQLLQLYSGRKVAKINMRFCFLRHHFSSKFDHWMHSISRLGVESLALQFACDNIYQYPMHDPIELFTFPLELLSQASSLKYLFLSHCIVQPSPTIRFNSLTTLNFRGALLSDQLEGILASCSNLERLFLEFCKLPLKLCFSSTVKTVVFWFCCGLEEIDLRAANLRRLEMNNYENVRFFFSFVPVLEYVMVTTPLGAAFPSYIFGDFARDLPPQVKALTVKLGTLPTELKMFRHLRQLSLLLIKHGSFKIVEICPLLDACPLLQCLELAVTFQLEDERGGGTPSLSPTCHSELKQVILGGFRGTRSEIEFALYILRSAIVLEQIFLSPRYNCYAGYALGFNCWQKCSNYSFDEIKRKSIRQELHGQAISEKAVVIFE